MHILSFGDYFLSHRQVWVVWVCHSRLVHLRHQVSVQRSPVECVFNFTFLIKKSFTLLMQNCKPANMLQELCRAHSRPVTGILLQHFMMLAYHMSVLPTHQSYSYYFFFLRSGCYFLKGCLGRPNWLGKQTPEAEEMRQVQIFNLMFLKHFQGRWEVSTPQHS